MAQDIVPPSARTISIDGGFQSLKTDLRNYTYEGSVQLVAARLYQGQTTNFRTMAADLRPCSSALAQHRRRVAKSGQSRAIAVRAGRGSGA